MVGGRGPEMLAKKRGAVRRQPPFVNRMRCPQNQLPVTIAPLDEANANEPVPPVGVADRVYEVVFAVATLSVTVVL